MTEPTKEPTIQERLRNASKYCIVHNENRGYSVVMKAATDEIDRLQAIVDTMPKYDDTGEPIIEGDAVYEIVGGHRPGSPYAIGIGCARLCIDDDFEERKLTGCFKNKENAEAELRSIEASND